MPDIASELQLLDPARRHLIHRVHDARGRSIQRAEVVVPVDVERAGLLGPGPMLFSYRTDAEALAALAQSAGSPEAPISPSPVHAGS